MRFRRFTAWMLALLFLTLQALPAAAIGVGQVDGALQGAAIDEAGVAASCAGGSCGGGGCAGGSCGGGGVLAGLFGGGGGIGGFLQGIVGFLKNIFGGIFSAISNLFGGIFGGGGGIFGGGDCGGGGCNGGDCGGGGCNGGDCGGGYTPPTDGGGTATTSGGTATTGGDTSTSGGTATTGGDSSTSGGTATTGGDSSTSGGTATTGGSSTPTAAGPLPIRSDIRTGGGNMERTGYSWAAGAVVPRTNDPTVLRHEAVHYINGELTVKNGGDAMWRPNTTKSHSFYIWGENRYWVVPDTGVRKADVEALVPTHVTTSQSYFHNGSFAGRDALHLMEDLSAEISSQEKSALLCDMIIYNAALGLKMEQLNAGPNKYWSGEQGAKFRGAYKDFIERAGAANIPRMVQFRGDSSPKTAALKSFLRRTYGSEWTAKYLGF